MRPTITSQEEFDRIKQNLAQLRTFDTGSKRSVEADAERYDLISEIGLERLARTYAEGIAKGYEMHNWRLGQPFSVVLNHVLWHLNKYKKGENGEDHLAHAAFGLFALMEFETTHTELNDLYAYQDKQPAGSGDHGAAVRAATAGAASTEPITLTTRELFTGSSHSYTTPHQEPEQFEHNLARRYD